jgi:outer membrane protein
MKFAAAMTAAVCILACGTLPVSAQQTGAAAPETEPLTLAEARGIALQNHPDIAAAGYRAQAEQQVFVQARAGLLPQVNLYGSAVHADSDNTRLLAGGLNNPSVFSRTAFGAGATQLITDFGRTSNLVAGAKLSASAADQNSLAARAQVLLQVDQNYFSVLEALAIEDVARQTLNTRQLLVDRVTLLAQNKLKSDLDKSFAQVALEDAHLLVLNADNSAESALAALSTSLGYRDPHRFKLADETTVPVPATENVSDLTDLAMHDRPELASLRDSRDAAQRQARSQRDARLPTISAVVAAGNSPSHDSRLADNYSAGGLQVSVPLFAGGLYQARQREAELRAKAAAETLRTAEDNISRDVHVAWLNLNNARQRFHAAGQLRRYAATAYELADARYKAGSSSIVELSQAQLALTSAQIDETAARYEVLMRESDLNYQIGVVPRTEMADEGKPP